VDTLQQQLSIISEKIDGLYQQQEILGNQVATLLKVQPPQSISNTPIMESSREHSDIFRSTHRDILTDQEPIMIQDHGNSKPMSQELQMQRLMAQLTAAYNRIAALEEQLIAQRIH
jgi:hypothetical protein